MNKHNCKVCGLYIEDSPWGVDGKSPTTRGTFISGKNNFMEPLYIMFKNPAVKSKRKGFFIRSLFKFIRIVIPMSNPDFELKIGSVATWLLELPDVTSIPNREVGLDIDGNTIVKMPYKNNSGYWTDNNLRLEDFEKNFEVRNIDKEYFETCWDKLGW